LAHHPVELIITHVHTRAPEGDLKFLISVAADNNISLSSLKGVESLLRYFHVNVSSPTEGGGMKGGIL
jgi:hypothetical protein